MTGTLLAPLPFSSPSPVRLVASSYSVDSFSEFSTRSVNHTFVCGPRSARAKEEDEELFRDLFAGENEAEACDNAPGGLKCSVSLFIPQKPGTRRASSSTGNSNPRQHLVPVKLAPPQPVLSSPFIPRLNLGELLNARPDDDDEDDNKNDSRRTSRHSSELEQVTEEPENCFDDGPNETKGGKTDSRNAQVLTRDREFYNGLRFANNNQIPSSIDRLEQDTLRFLEKLDLKAVLHTPRPDILNFYPDLTMAPASRNMTSQNAKAAKITENCFVTKDGAGLVKRGNDFDTRKASRVDSVTSRLAHMKSTYGTVPIVRKARGETIDRLANPFSGHSSTLQALSPKQREKRKAALTGRAPFSPISAAIAVSCRRSTTTKKAKPSGTFLAGLNMNIGDCEIPMPTLATLKRKAVKRQDPLLHRRRITTKPVVDVQSSVSNVFTKRKSKTTLGPRSLLSRKEALRKKFQSGSGLTNREGPRKIGGSTFLTQRDDEEGVELVEDFVARNRGAAQASLTFRSGTKRHTISNLPTRNPATVRSRPRLPQTHGGVTAIKNTYRGRGTQTFRGRQFLENSTKRKATKPTRSGSDHEPDKRFQQPRRPQVGEVATTIDLNTTRTRSLTGRPTISNNMANPRRLKVQPPTQTLRSRAPKDLPSAATALLMGSTLLSSLLGSSTDDVKSARRDTKKVSVRKPTRRSSRNMITSLDKQLEQPKRATTTARVKRGEKPTARRSTSRL